MSPIIALSNIEESQRKLIKCTKFARIYNVSNEYAIKSITTDYVIAPHNPQKELEILNKLNKEGSKTKVTHVILLLDHQKNGDELELLFPYYHETLHDFMVSQFKEIGDGLKQKKKFNPYYSISPLSMDTDQQEVKTQSIYKNEFDVNRYAFGFFQQLLAGLVFLHENGIIHRDIKPQNIMLDVKSMELLITDFGISYDTTDKTQTIMEKFDEKCTDISTGFYKAPELLFSVKCYSFAVDIWSLMVIVSQWFQKVSTSDPNELIPAIFDDGSGILESGSDIRLILSIFDKIGVPSVVEWPEVRDFGSKDAFVGLFGDGGDGKYLLNKEISEQREKVIGYMPGLLDLTDNEIKNKFISCFLGMLSLDSTKRWSSKCLLELLSN